MKTLLSGWFTVIIMALSSPEVSSQKMIITCDTLEYFEYSGKEDFWNLIEVYKTFSMFLIDSSKNSIRQLESINIHDYEITDKERYDGNTIYNAINKEKHKFKILLMPDAVLVYEYSFDRNNWVVFRWVINAINYE